MKGTLVTRGIQTSEGKEVAIVTYGIGPNGLKAIEIESAEGDNEYISEFTNKDRERLKQLGIDINEE